MEDVSDGFKEIIDIIEQNTVPQHFISINQIQSGQQKDKTDSCEYIKQLESKIYVLNKIKEHCKSSLKVIKEIYLK